MTEPQSSYSVMDLEHLTPEQAEQLRFVLSVLSLHQLVMLAAKTEKICNVPGFGEIVLTIVKHHPDEIRAGQTEKFLPILEGGELDKLMKEK